MKRFIESADRNQGTLFPEYLEDFVAEDNPVRVVDVFVENLNLGGLGFRADPAATGRPSYHPSVLLKLQAYGELMRQIAGIIKVNDWKQADAAALYGVTQPRINDLLHGRVSRFSLDALVNIATSLGRRVHMKLDAA